MIEEIAGLPDGTLGFRFSGQVKDEDYEPVLVPTIERAIERHERIKALIHFGPDFEKALLVVIPSDPTKPAKDG